MSQNRDRELSPPTSRPDGSVASRRFLPITVDGCALLIEASQVLDTERGDNVQRNPTTKPPYGWLLGKFEGLEVQSLGRFLKLDDAGHDGTILIVSTADGTRRGWLVDTLGDAVEIRASDLASCEAGAATAPYVGVARIGDEHRWVLSFEGSESRSAPAARPMATADDLVTEAEEPPATGLRMIWIRSETAPGVIIGFSSTQVVEIREPASILPFPKRERRFLGVAVFDQTGVPFIEPSAIAGSRNDDRRARTPSRGQRLVVVRATRSERIVGVAADTIEMVDLPVEVRPIPIADPAIRGAYALGDEKLIVPDLDSLLDTK